MDEPPPFATPPTPGALTVPLVTDRADLRAAVVDAASRVDGVSVVVTDTAGWRPDSGDAAWAVVGLDALRAVPPPDPHRRPRRLLVVSGPDEEGDAWPVALRWGADDLAVPGTRGDVPGWLHSLRADRPCGAVGLVGGRGGAGASTAAVALARVAARRHGRAVLVDADPVGGGLDLLLGAEAVPGLRWPDLAGTAGGLSARWLVRALPAVDGVCVLSQARSSPGGSGPASAALAPDVVGAALDGCLSSGAPVVVDLPRHGEPLVDPLLARCRVAVVVVPAEVRACAAAAALLERTALPADVRLLVRGPAPAGLSAEDVAAVVGVPTFAEVRPEPGLPVALERGEPVAVSSRSPLRRWAESLASTLGETWPPPPPYRRAAP